MEHINKPKRNEVVLLNCNYHTGNRASSLNSEFTKRLGDLKDAVSQVIHELQNVNGAVKWVYFCPRFKPISILSDSRSVDVEDSFMLMSLCRGFPDDKQPPLCVSPQYITIDFFLTTNASMACIGERDHISFENTGDICKWLKYFLTDMSVFLSLSSIEHITSWWEIFTKRAARQKFISKKYVFDGYTYYEKYHDKCKKFLLACINISKRGNGYEVPPRRLEIPRGFAYIEADDNNTLLTIQNLNGEAGINRDDFDLYNFAIDSAIVEDCLRPSPRISEKFRYPKIKESAKSPHHTQSEAIRGKYTRQVSDKKFQRQYDALEPGQYVFVIFITVPSNIKEKQYARIRTLLGNCRLKSWKFFTLEQYRKRIKEFKKVEGCLAITVFEKQ